MDWFLDFGLKQFQCVDMVFVIVGDEDCFDLVVIGFKLCDIGYDQVDVWCVVYIVEGYVQIDDDQLFVFWFFIVIDIGIYVDFVCVVQWQIDKVFSYVLFFCCNCGLGVVCVWLNCF